MTEIESGKVLVAHGAELAYTRQGAGEPLLLIMGTSGSQGLWAPVVPGLAEQFEVITFDNRGLGDSTRGTGAVTMAQLTQDTAALLDAIGVQRAHVCGWSLGSAVAQELALAHADKVASLVLYATWGRLDGFQRSLLAALAHPWRTGDIETAFTAMGLAFSPELLDSPDFEQLFEQFLPLFPQTPAQFAATVEQWDADFAHDTLDRLSAITAPTLVLVGEQDLLTPPRQSRAVADLIPGAQFELVTGPGSSHGLHIERTDEWVALVRAYVAQHVPARAA